jgi:murein DD-endopeptidase MepM/ murein hydrolase activator NlpD
VLVGCELAFSGGLTPDSWSRELWLGAPLPRIVENAHVDRSGLWVEYDQIPRRPERPESYTAYRYPLAHAPVVSGYDLDKPDDEQRRGRMNAVGHGGVDLVAEIGAPISMVRLEHQVGDAEVLYVGWLYGETVVTRHVVREGGAARDYLLIFGHLDRAGEDVRRGRRLRDGATVGFVGNSDSPQLVHLHLEARRVRDGVDTWRLPGDALHAREFSVVSDPRNVLPLADPPRRTPRCAPRLAPPARRYWLGDAMVLSLGDSPLP